jgi:Uma2 family endonuclease
MATVAEKLVTAEEFGRLPDDGPPKELVRGRVVILNMPKPRHGQICSKVVRVLGGFVDQHDLGHVLSNDAGVVTERDPDSVRGPDIAFYSFARVPRGPLPEEYLSVVPDLVFEVRSPGDRWTQINAKASEYVEAGVKAVCVLDQQTETALVFTADDPPRTLTPEQELTFPDILGDFRVLVRRFFE